MTAPEALTAPPETADLFSRVIVGVDPSAQSREAVRQATRLMDGHGYLQLVAAYELLFPAAVTGMTIAAYTDEHADLYRREAAAALEWARDVAGRDDVVARVVKGRPADVLIAAAERERATLIAVGGHCHGRAAGILLGPAATEIVHRAPCSVLVARRQSRAAIETIVVGLDGSPASEAAYRAARDLVGRVGADLWPVVAYGGKGVDREAIDALTTRRQDTPDKPIEALVATAADADLLVVGSRRLHGMKALGSVSERVAHEAACSTLIVRQQQSETP